MHDHHHSENKANIAIAFGLNLAFAVIEFVGGYLTNSLAVFANALHDLGDSFSIGLSWYFAKLSEQTPTKQFSYGFKRFSLLAAFINGIILLVGSLLILSKAFPRVLHPEPSHPGGMLVFAVIGIAVNALAMLRLHHGKTMNEKMLAWHFIEDILGWVAVLIAGIIMLFIDIPVLDPILSILITCYVLWNVFKNFRKTIVLFMQGVPEELKVETINQKMRSVAMVQSIHDTHIWSLDGEHHILTAHIVVESALSKEQILAVKCQLKKILSGLGIPHATLEIELKGEECAACGL